MKKYLLTPLLGMLCVVPAFSAFPGADMDNTNIEGNTTSSNMRPHEYNRSNKKHDENNKDVEANTKTEQMPPRHYQDKKTQETSSAIHNDRPNPNHHSTKHHKKTKSKEQGYSHNNHKDAKEEENENLKNIAQPDTSNINNNLRIPDGETIRLNREMMLDGPQGGIQNNQFRGIGDRSL